METISVIDSEQIDVWFRINKLIPEKSELYYDFIMTLLYKVQNTYLGDSDGNITNIEISEYDKEKHFDWCWDYTINLFKKENIVFNDRGNHYSYLKGFFFKVFYREVPNLRDIVNSYISDVFNRESEYTKDKLTLYTEIYRTMDKNLIP